MGTKLWNVMIHMAADNNLKDECIYELNEILGIGRLTELDVVAQFDSGSSVTVYDYRVPEPDEAATSTASRAEADLVDPPELDDIARLIITGREELQRISDSQIIADFLQQHGSGEKFNFISLSGHGAGAVGEFLPSDDPPNALSIPELKSRVLEPLANRLREGKIDLLGLDSCLMSMVETCFQLQGLVRILISAEGLEQNAGWPYHKILRDLQANPRTPPRELAKRVVRDYVRNYAPYYASGISVDLSACDLGDEKMNALTSAIRHLAARLRQNLLLPQVESAILIAHWRAQSYKFEQYTDLWDFCHLLKTSLDNGIFNTAEFKSPSLLFDEWEAFSKTPGTPDRWAAFKETATYWEEVRREIEDGCRDVMAAIDNVVIDSGYHGAAFQHSHGLSIYFPWSKTELARNIAPYSELAFSSATGWDQFLIAYINRTQREVRDDHGLRERGIPPMGMSPKGGASVHPPKEPKEIDHRVTPPIDTRVTPPIDTRVTPPIDTRGKLAFSPEVKNPPTEFYRENPAALNQKTGKRHED
ncbi:MAG: clostripain-related cysteine peptidase [Blastocatellia bacterium]